MILLRTAIIALFYIDFNSLKSTAQIVTDGSHKYLDCQHFGEWNMDEMQAIRFHSPFYGRNPTVQYPHDFECHWKFKGTEKCTPVIYCDRDIQIRTFQDEKCGLEFLRIEDGSGGENFYCGDVASQEVHIKPLRGRDLLVTFKANANPEFKSFFSGFSCTATCKGNLGIAKPLNSKTSPKICSCGTVHRPQRRRRLAGGTPAELNGFPWMAVIVNKTTRFPICGATIVSDHYVLTSASCFRIGHTDITKDEVDVLIHAFSLDNPYESDDLGQFAYSARTKSQKSDSDEKSERFALEKIIFHPSFSLPSIHNDAALIKLSNNIALGGKLASTICFPETSSLSSPVNIETVVKTYEGQRATTIGFGFATHNKDKQFRVLRTLNVPILPRSECIEMYKNFGFSDKIICAGFLNVTGQDACEGDAGNPLLIKTKTEQYQQIGIQSFGLGCMQKAYTATYTSVHDILEWIQSTIKGSVSCPK